MTKHWLKECSVKIMTPTESSWLAGFIDGEGSICSYMAGRNRNHQAWIISVVNTDIRALEKCQNITGCGFVRSKSKPKTERHKQIYTWTVTRKRDIKSVCEQILPYCAIKAEQIQAFMNAWEEPH